MHKKIFLYPLFLVLAIPSFSQILDPTEYNFAFQVKQVDEFIERFNGDTSTLLYEYRSQKFPNKQMDREIMIKTLFDNMKGDWNFNLVKAFIKEVTDPEKPIYISFYDDDWYALLECNILYKGRKEKAIITLAVEKEEDYSSKWVIRGVKADFLDIQGEDSDHVFLNPVSHGTDFMNLSQLFKADKKHIKSYLYRNFHPGGMALFIHELIDGNITFQQVNTITYHFLQVNGWVFSLRKVYRESPNSGWLISNIQRIGTKDKAVYRSKVLNLD